MSSSRRCLVHVVRSANVRYSKVRPLHPLCQFDVCRHEVRYGCQREDSCSFAHSVIELKCWVLQQDTGTCCHTLILSPWPLPTLSHTLTDIHTLTLTHTHNHLGVGRLYDASTPFRPFYFFYFLLSNVFTLCVCVCVCVCVCH